MAIRIGEIGAAPSRPRVAAGLLCAGLLSRALPARAADLTWSAPADCAVQVDVREQVERLIGQSLDSVRDIEFTVEVEKKSAKHWLLRLSTSAAGERGLRQMEGASCSEIAEAGAVAIAMAARLRTEELQAAEAARPAAKASVVETPAPPLNASKKAAAQAQARPATASALHFAFALGGIVDVGALPSASPGVELDAALDIGALRVLALGALHLPQSRKLTQDRGGEFSLMLGGALACLRQPARSWMLFGCGGFELGRLSGEGQGAGVVESRLGSYLWAAGRADFGASAALAEDWVLMLRAGVAAPLQRRPFVLDADVVYRPSSLVGRALLGIEIRL